MKTENKSVYTDKAIQGRIHEILQEARKELEAAASQRSATLLDQQLKSIPGMLGVQTIAQAIDLLKSHERKPAPRPGTARPHRYAPIPAPTRNAVENDLKEGRLSIAQISRRRSVSPSTVFSVKQKLGLVKERQPEPAVA